MPAFKCLKCKAPWPHDNAWRICPLCEQLTSIDYTSTALDEDEAVYLVNHMLFDRYWKEWELARFREQLAEL